MWAARSITCWRPRSSRLQVVGKPGVRPAWGLRIPTIAGRPRTVDDRTGVPFLADGQRFSINDGTRTITFELDDLDDPLGGGRTTAPNIVVAYRGKTSTTDQIANVLVAAIQNAPLQGLKPTYAGHGMVLLGEPISTASGYTVDVTRTGLQQTGQAGVPAAVPVVVTPEPTFDGTQVAVAILQAINGANGAGVTATSGLGNVVLLSGASRVTDFGAVFVSNTFYPGIKDLAGNDLKPSLLSGETQTAMVLGNVALDFGDAPQTAGGHYPTQLGPNGAVHVVTNNPLYLGTRIDAEPDGLVSALSRGDDLDSEGWLVDASRTPNVTLTSTLTPTILTMPEPLTLRVAHGNAIADGSVFQVTNRGVTVSFEMDSNNSLVGQLNVRVPFQTTSTADQVANTVVATLAARTELGLRPANLGLGAVHVGGSVLSVFGTTGLTQTGTAHPIQDGQTFFIDPDANGPTPRVTFEFEDVATSSGNGVAAGNLPVFIDEGTTRDGYARAVSTAVLGARLGIAATSLGQGRLELSGQDEDGVEMGAFNPNTVTQVIITASAPGLLDAWVDFNADGDFSDTGEQIFASEQLQQGANPFEVNPAPDTRVGATQARFRFSSVGGLKPTGLAPDGEVEDYRVSIIAGNPPVAVADQYTFNEDAAGRGTSVLANDTDADVGDQALLTVASADTGSKLGAQVQMDLSSTPGTKGTFTYDPRLSSFLQALDAGQTATDTFTYRAKDALFLSAAATVTVTVQGRNDSPVAFTDANVVTSQNSPVSIDVLANDTDPENHTLTVVSASGSQGLVTVVNNRVVYDPAGKFNRLDISQTATDGFTYQISDGRGGLATGSVVVTVTGLNDPPTAVDDVAPTAQADEDNPATINVLTNDTDPEYVGPNPPGAPLTVTLVQPAGTRGLVTVNQPGTLRNSVTYNPNGKFETLAENQPATDLFTYVVADPQGNTSLATVTMTILGRNDAPTATNDSGTVARNATLTLNVVTNDRDIDRGDVLTVTPPLGTTNTRGAVVINSDNTVTYNPNRAFDFLQIGQQATDRFTYTISDGHGGSATATVTLTVIGASNPPVAVNDQPAPVGEKDSVIIPVLSNDTDDFGPLSVASVNTAGLKGSVLINPPAGTTNNSVIYSPTGQFDYLASGQTAQETFTYVVTDGTGNATGTVTVTIQGVNDPPVANYDANSYRVQRRGTLTANDARGTTTPQQPGDDGVLLNDTDAEGDAITAVLVTPPQFAAFGSFRLNPDGTFTYSNNGSTATVDSFAYQARDAHNATSQQVVTVLIQITDAPPPEWQNPISQFDVNNDGFVSPVDVLLVINYINEQGSFQLPSPRPVGEYFYDVDGDGWLKPVDVLALINELNARNTAGGEGEAVVVAPANAESVPQGLPPDTASLALGTACAGAVGQCRSGVECRSTESAGVAVDGARRGRP